MNNNISFSGNEYVIRTMNKDNYDEDLLEKINICDPNILDKTLEQYAYYALEEDQIGFFLTNQPNTKLYASAIIDLTCSKYAKLLERNEINVNNSFEITLLCANKNEPVTKGLTRHFIHYIIHTLIKQYMPNPEHIVLNLGGGESNQVALRFYTGLGFKKFVGHAMPPNMLIYEYPPPPPPPPPTRRKTSTKKRKIKSGPTKKKISMKQVRRTFRKTF